MPAGDGIGDALAVLGFLRRMDVIPVGIVVPLQPKKKLGFDVVPPIVSLAVNQPREREGDLLPSLFNGPFDVVSLTVRIGIRIKKSANLHPVIIVNILCNMTV